MIFNQIQEEHQKLFDANGEYSLSICSITSSMLLNTGKMEKLDDLRRSIYCTGTPVTVTMNSGFRTSIALATVCIVILCTGWGAYLYFRDKKTEEDVVWINNPDFWNPGDIGGYYGGGGNYYGR